jgi:hypothetical protein|tara:strand:- start:402 stop:596 length:195 start_codon:yes stop_codon:yes gene_type:complete
MGRKLGKKARKQQIIENLTRSIELGGNTETIEKLKEILESVQNDTFVSQFKKRAKRKPKKKKES